jgi:hypothetical protein
MLPLGPLFTPGSTSDNCSENTPPKFNALLPSSLLPGAERGVISWPILISSKLRSRARFVCFGGGEGD